MSDDCQKCQRSTIMPMSWLTAAGIFPSNEDDGTSFQQNPRSFLLEKAKPCTEQKQISLHNVAKINR